jgi:hypothetical protein
MEVQTELQRLRARLNELVVSVPPAINSADIETVRKFKAAVVAGNKVKGNTRAGQNQVAQAVRDIERYWR